MNGGEDGSLKDLTPDEAEFVGPKRARGRFGEEVDVRMTQSQFDAFASLTGIKGNPKIHLWEVFVLGKSRRESYLALGMNPSNASSAIARALNSYTLIRQAAGLEG